MSEEIITEKELNKLVGKLYERTYMLLDRIETVTDSLSVQSENENYRKELDIIRDEVLDTRRFLSGIKNEKDIPRPGGIMKPREIDYRYIDVYCRPMVRLFNQIGLPTKFCCQGHGEIFNETNYINHTYNIVFDDSVSDDDIERLLKDAGYLYGDFMKSTRPCGHENTIRRNWMYIVDFGMLTTNVANVRKDFLTIQRACDEDDLSWDYSI